MSGHSKWANIKHKKEASDKKKGKVFSKLAKEIMVCVKQSGKDPNSNPRLRMALIEARSANMPRENIDRAIKKGAGELGNIVYEEIVYEGYGPQGTAIIVECLTAWCSTVTTVISPPVVRSVGCSREKHIL